MTHTIAVFGASHYPSPDHPDWQTFYQLGAQLARQGYKVLTGGYSGIMEVVSQGAYEAQGEVIGVTCRSLETWHQTIQPNAYLTQEIAEPTLLPRIETIIRRSDACLVLPGGVGTLAELACCWNMISVDEVPLRPLILYGADWQAFLDAFFQTLGAYIHNRGEGFLYTADSTEAILRILDEHLQA